MSTHYEVYAQIADDEINRLADLNSELLDALETMLAKSERLLTDHAGFVRQLGRDPEKMIFAKEMRAAGNTARSAIAKAKGDAS